jgi:hypothetical protein
VIKIRKRIKDAVLLDLKNGDQKYFIIKKDKKPKVGEFLVAGTYAYVVTGVCSQRGYQISGYSSWNPDEDDYYLGELV